MFKKLLWCVGLLAALGLAGCIDEATVVTVDKTGGGTVVSTIYMSKTMLATMDQMAGAMGGEANKAAPKNPMLADIGQYKTKTASMGEGVTFVSAKEVKKDDGSLGVQVTYAFKDINKLKVNSEPDTPSSGGEAPAKKAKDPVSFVFVKGATPKLTILMPKAEKPASAVKPEAGTTETKEPAKTPSAAELAQMKQMFDGFRVRLIVKVDGFITKSNASFIEKISKTDKKQAVTLIDMDVGKLLKDEATFKKLAAMGDISDMVTAKEKMKNIPGLKFEPADKIDIEFE